MIHVDEVLKVTEGDNPSQIIVNQYRVVYGEDFDNNEKFPKTVPFPKANRNTNDRIVTKFMSLFPKDRVLIGLAWMNQGFTVDENVPDGYVQRGDV